MRRSTRRRRLFDALLGALLALALFGPAHVAAQADDAPPLDLAAMAFTPDDLEAEGLEGYRMRASRYQTVEQVAVNAAKPLDFELEELIDELEETGLGRSYLAALDVTEDQATYGLPPTERVVVYLSEHENAEGAEAGFALREEERDPAAEDLDDVEAFGDESEVTRFVGETDDGELAFTGLDLTTRVDRLYGGVQLINYAPAGDEVEEPELETLEALGSLLVERLEAGLDGAGPGLSAQIVRLTQTDAPTIIAFDYYEVIDGEVVIPVGHTDELIALLEEEVEEYDITARYRVDQYVQVDPEEMQIPVDPYMVLRVSRFADEDQAAAWVDESLERLSSAPHFSDIEAIDDAEPLGDRSVTATYLYEFDDETTLTGHAINVQVGDIGFSLQVDVGSLAGTTEIAEAQLECLDSGACLELLEVPENLATSD